MSTLIDGYNLLHATGIVGQGVRSGGLQESRLALLSFLAASIDPAELPRTTVVFDAQNSPPGLPRILRYRGMIVRFASGRQTADDLIAALIWGDSAPRRLVVVSSDHAIQRAARRRRAKPIDSDVWYAELVRSRRARNNATAEDPERPTVPLLEEDVNYWLRQFGNLPASADSLGEMPRPSAATSPPPVKPVDEEDGTQLDNPFPPGYGEDLLREL
jgi:uncharacterized protein